MVGNNNSGIPSSDPATQAFNSFPIVKAADIVTSLSQELNIQVTLEEITKPNFNVASRCFQAFMEALTGYTVTDIENDSEKHQKEMMYRECYDEAIPIWLQLYEIQCMMRAAMVMDFGLQDLTRPDPKRFRRHLSALINFIRFRADRVVEVEQLEGETNDEAEHLEHLREEIATTQARIDEERARREQEAPLEKEVKAENDNLSASLMEMKDVQTKLVEEVDHVRAEKAALMKKQSENVQEQVRLAQLLQRLDSRIIQSPKKLRTKLTEGTNEVATLKKDLAALQLRSRELEKKLDSLDKFERDLKASQVSLDNLDVDLRRVADQYTQRESISTQIEEGEAVRREASHRQERMQERATIAHERCERLELMLANRRAQQKEENLANQQRKRDLEERARLAQLEVEKLKREFNECCNEITAIEEGHKQSKIQWVQTRDALVQIGEKYAKDQTRMLSFHQ